MTLGHEKSRNFGTRPVILLARVPKIADRILASGLTFLPLLITLRDRRVNKNTDSDLPVIVRFKLKFQIESQNHYRRSPESASPTGHRVYFLPQPLTIFFVRLR